MSLTPLARRRIFFSVVLALVVVLITSLVNGLAGGSGRPSAGRRAGGETSSGAVSSKGSADSSGGRVAIYAHDGVGSFTSATRNAPYLLYVPESGGTGVDVVDPNAMRIIGHYSTGLDPQHVVPSYDLRTLYSTNDLANSLTPFDPMTGRPSGPNIPVSDPYNMYFTPGGAEAIVVAEARQELDFYDAHSFSVHNVVHVDCAGVDHADFSADGQTMLVSCEFAHRLVRIDVVHHAVLGYVDLPGSSPQDVRISPDGAVFYVADMYLGGVHLIDARRFVEIGFLPTGKDAHGLYPSRDGTRLFISNRGSGSISVLDFASRTLLTTWHLPGGGSPDMGGVSPDGTVLWLSGRYNATVYKVSTADGRLLGQVHVPLKPHGLCVWPQPGRFSLGHTGNMR